VARILLVEDDEAVRDILKKALVSSGHEVEEAENGNVALAAYRRQPCDLVITDLVMPEKDGLETILELRRMNPAVKIVAMSGGGRTLGPGQFYLESAQLFGAYRVLAKPFTAAAFLHSVSGAGPENGRSVNLGRLLIFPLVIRRPACMARTEVKARSLTRPTVSCRTRLRRM
jgi:CheY-like chemotaxis protein